MTAEQTGYNTITVTGAELSDKAADYVIKRGNTPIAIGSLTPAEDKKSVKITSATNKLTEGDYTLAYGETTVEFTVAKEAVTTIEYVGTDLVLAAGDTGAQGDVATIKYHILNQFGEKMTGSIIPSSTLGTANVTTNTTRYSDGVVTVNLGVTCYVGVTTGVMNLTETNSGKTGSPVNVVVNSPAVLSAVEVLGIYDLSGTAPVKATLDTNCDPTDFAILLTAFDQYGDVFGDFDATDAQADATITVAGASGLGVALTDYSNNLTEINGVNYITVPFTGAMTGLTGTTYVNIIGNTKGLLQCLEVEVAQGVAIAEFSISPLDTLYVGSKGEVAYTAVDTNGDIVTDYNALSKALGAAAFNGNTDFAWERQADGSAKLFVTPTVGQSLAVGINPNQTNTASTTVVFQTKVGYSIKTEFFTVYEAKLPRNIVGIDADAPLAAIIGGNGHVKLQAHQLKVVDQYGNVMSDFEFMGSTYKVGVVTTGAVTAFPAAAATTTAAVDWTNAYYNASTVVFDYASNSSPLAVGNVTVQLMLADGTGAKIENSEYNVKLSAVSIESVGNFEIKPLYNYGASVVDARTNDNATATDAAITVVGKVGGLTVAIPTENYTLYGSKHIVVTNNKYGTVALRDAYGNKTTATETIEVVIGNNAGTSVTLDVDLSSLDAVPSLAYLNTTALTASATSGAAVSTGITYADFSGKIDVLDQYGIADSTVPRVQFTELPEGFYVEKNNTALATVKTVANMTGKYAVPVTVYYGTTATYEGALIITLTQN